LSTSTVSSVVGLLAWAATCLDLREICRGKQPQYATTPFHNPVEVLMCFQHPPHRCWARRSKTHALPFSENEPLDEDTIGALEDRTILRGRNLIFKPCHAIRSFRDCTKKARLQQDKAVCPVQILDSGGTLAAFASGNPLNTLRAQIGPLPHSAGLRTADT